MDETVATFQDAFISRMDKIFDPNDTYPQKGQYANVSATATTSPVLHTHEDEKREDNEVHPSWRRLKATEDDEDTRSSGSSSSCSTSTAHDEKRDVDDDSLSCISNVDGGDDITVDTREVYGVISQVESGTSLLVSDMRNISTLRLPQLAKEIWSEFMKPEPLAPPTEIDSDNEGDDDDFAVASAAIINNLSVIVEEDEEEEQVQICEEGTKINVDKKKDDSFVAGVAEEADKPDYEVFFTINNPSVLPPTDDDSVEQKCTQSRRVGKSKDTVGNIFGNNRDKRKSIPSQVDASPTNDTVELQSTIIEDAKNGVSTFYGYDKDELTFPKETKREGVRDHNPEAPTRRKKKHFGLGKVSKKMLFSLRQTSAEI